MRKLFTALLACALVAATAFATACSSASTSTDAESTNREATNAAMADMHLRPIEQVTDADPLRAFAANTATAVLNGADADGTLDDPDGLMEKNLCYSPVSLYLACTLLGMGTQGSAQDQMLTLLGIESADQLQAQAQQVREQLENVYGDAVIKVADSIWAGSGYEFTDAYLQQVQALGGAAFDVSFGTDEGDRQISHWISEQTNGLLKPQILTEAGQAAMLLNTIYFKDAWADPFEVANDEVAAFQTPTFEVQANYLRGEITDSLYAEGPNYTAANLAFSGGSSMTFVRPNDDTILYQLFQRAEDVQELLSIQGEFRSVDWWIPKFQTDSSLRHLVEAMRALGVSEVFSPEDQDAFAPMLATDDGKDFCVGDVRQDTHLALDENGVEAAAFTAIGIEKMALAPEMEPVEFKLDRPFFYYVTSPNGTILFVGVMYNPNL